MPQIKLRLDPEPKQRARILRFLAAIGITRIEAGSITLPIATLSLDGLEEVALEEIRLFRLRRQIRAANRASQRDLFEAAQRAELRRPIHSSNQEWMS